MNNPWGQQQPITQQGPMGGFRRGMRGAFGDKSNMLATSLGLMFGQNPQQQMQAAQNGLMNGGQIRAQNAETQKAEQQRNATMEYFKANRPDLAAQVEAGMPMAQAWSELKAQPTIKPTSAMQNWEYGQKNPDFAAYQLAQKAAGATNINNNTQNPNKYIDESGKLAAGRLDEIATSANSAPELRGQIQQLRDMSALIGTGKGAEFTNAVGPYAQALGIDVEGLDAIQTFDSIVSKLAPQMRPVGSGSSSDKDVEMFLKSLPSLGNTPEGNQLIAGTFDAVLENRMKAAEIAKLTYIPKEQGGLTWWEAEQKINELPNPYEVFKQSGATAGTSLEGELDVDALVNKWAD